MSEYTLVKDCVYCSSLLGEVLGGTRCTHRSLPEIFSLAHHIAKEVRISGFFRISTVAEFLDDADSISRDFPGVSQWEVSGVEYPFRDNNGERYTEIIVEFKVNGVSYIVKEGELEMALPMKKSDYLEWLSEGDHNE